MKLLSAKAFIFTPGDQETKLLKSLQRNDCALVFDLEDAVMPEAKPQAREILKRILKEPHPAETVVIRINAPECGMLAEDMSVIEETMPQAVMMPKGTKANALALREAMEDMFARTGKQVPVIPIIETALGFEEMSSVFTILENVPFASFGGEDLATDLHIKRDPNSNQFEYARWRFVFGCAAYGVKPLDTVYTNLRDLEGLAAEVAHVKSMGMAAKTCIHPSHVDVINAGFLPSQKDVEEAKRILEIAALPENQGVGSIKIDGKMVDIPVIQRAKDVLIQAGLL